MGIIGATEYVQDNKKLLQERAVAYINLDVLVHGNESLKACGNPMMVDLVYEQSKMVSDPHGPQESIYSVWKKGRPDPAAADRPQFYTSAFGSDYIPFYEMAGKIICADEYSGRHHTGQWTIPQLTKILNSTSLDKNFITA
jgi:hypothetical protein